MSEKREPRVTGKPPITQKGKQFCPHCRYDTVEFTYGFGLGGFGQHWYCKCGWAHFVEDVG